MTSPQLKKGLLDILACPVCHAPVVPSADGATLVCQMCYARYEVRDGIPIMLDPESKMEIEVNVREMQGRKLMSRLGNESLTARLVRIGTPPSAILNTGARQGYSRMRELLEARSVQPRLLVIGSGAEPGQGTEALGEELNQTCINLDIAPFPLVDVVGTGQRLPFLPSSFDGVAIQAVLEHVPYPDQVVAEIHRVLKAGGCVYAEIPFLQGFHAGPGDYRRYTISGITVLFEEFEPLDVSVCCGPSSALAEVLRNYMALLFSFGNDLIFKVLLRGFGWLVLPLKYLDLFLIRNKNAYVLASGVSFLGKKPGKLVGENVR